MDSLNQFPVLAFLQMDPGLEFTSPQEVVEASFFSGLIEAYRATDRLKDQVLSVIEPEKNPNYQYLFSLLSFIPASYSSPEPSSGHGAKCPF